MHSLSRRSFLSLVFLSAIGAHADAPEKPAAVVTALAEKKQTIVAYGTSRTAGGAWVGQLTKALEAKFQQTSALGAVQQMIVDLLKIKLPTRL